MPAWVGGSLAFHPSGEFLHVWGKDYAVRHAPHASVVTLSVADEGELEPFAQTPVPGAVDDVEVGPRLFGGQTVVTRPVPGTARRSVPGFRCHEGR